MDLLNKILTYSTQICAFADFDVRVRFVQGFATQRVRSACGYK